MSESKLSRAEAKEANRRSLLEAGFALLKANPAVDVTSQIRVVDVAQRADLSTGAFYSNWASQEDYFRELLEYALDQERLQATQSDTLQAIEQAREGGLAFEDFVRVAAQVAFENLLRDETFTIFVAAWPMARTDPGLQESLAQTYRSVTDAYSLIYANVMSAYGLTFRDSGMTVESLAVMLTCMLEGFVMRAAIDPGGAGITENGTANVFTTMVSALLQGLSKPAQT